MTLHLRATGFYLPYEITHVTWVWHPTQVNMPGLNLSHESPVYSIYKPRKDRRLSWSSVMYFEQICRDADAITSLAGPRCGAQMDACVHSPAAAAAAGRSHGSTRPWPTASRSHPCVATRGHLCSSTVLSVHRCPWCLWPTVQADQDPGINGAEMDSLL